MWALLVLPMGTLSPRVVKGVLLGWMILIVWPVIRESPWALGLLLPQWAFVAFPPRTPRQRLGRHLPTLAQDSVFTFAPTDERQLCDVLVAESIDTLPLDGSRITSTTDLARELDATLGPFRYPEDPAAKVQAHIRHERRGSGAIAILWRHAEVFRRADAAAFERFTADWEHAMRRNGAARLLLLDLAPAA